MGNENEVKYLLEKTKSVFLPGDFSDPDGSRIYILWKKNSEKQKEIEI